MDIYDFFTRIIDGYLFHDLKNMNELKQKKGEPAGAAGYPMLATTASAMELLGSILQQSGTYKDDAASSSGYFKYYWNEYLTPVDERYKEKDKIFWVLIRHGVAHTYFAKVGITVTKRKPSKHLLRTASGLNVDCSTFYRDFHKSYKTLVKKRLKDDEFAKQVQININKLFELSSAKADGFGQEIYFPRETPFVTPSGTIFEQPKSSSTYTAIPPDVLRSVRNQISVNSSRASGASIARPVDDIQTVHTLKKPPVG